MLSVFQQYQQAQKLFDSNTDKILLAVSGGADSVAMLSLFAASGYTFGVAHCNFGLRGSESDGDAHFVELLAQKYQVPFFATTFDTAEYAQQKGISIQMAARELRYDWLENTRHHNGFRYIATAHHLDDSIETFFINLLKGCGIRGLQGIPAYNAERHVIRPLGFATKAQILEYLSQAQIAHREDSSNATDKYLRNQLRHHLVPLLLSVQPDLPRIFSDNFHRLGAAAWLYDWSCQQWRERCCKEEENALHIDLSLIQELPVCNTLLFEWLSPFGFNIQQIEQMLAGVQAGAYTDSHSHRLLRDRAAWIVTPLSLYPTPSLVCVEISEAQGNFRWGNRHFQYQILDKAPEFKYEKSPRTAYFDADKIGKTLHLRPWQQGERFQPLGMAGKSKKISDYLKDAKVNLQQKNEVLVLCAQSGEVAWLLGFRLDHRFAVTAVTKQVLVVWESDTTT